MKIGMFLILIITSCAISAQKPNILLIMADDVSIGSIGVYGSEYIQPPKYNRVAQKIIIIPCGSIKTTRSTHVI